MADTQTYICPAGERLQRSGSIDRGFYMYFSKASICKKCTLRLQCTNSKKNVRKLKRHIAHEQIEKGRAQSHSGWARRDRRRRRHLMEGSFAHASNRHGFKRARWRRLHNQRTQDFLIAACQNIWIYLRHHPLNPAVSMAGGVGKLEICTEPRIVRETKAIPRSVNKASHYLQTFELE